jgi:hypothetical protein
MRKTTLEFDGMGNGDPFVANIEPKGDCALDIHEKDAHVILYLQVDEVLVGLTPKERDQVLHMVKQFKWEGNSFLQVWING